MKYAEVIKLLNTYKEIGNYTIYKKDDKGQKIKVIATQTQLTKIMKIIDGWENTLPLPYKGSKFPYANLIPGDTIITSTLSKNNNK